MRQIELQRGVRFEELRFSVLPGPESQTLRRYLKTPPNNDARQRMRDHEADSVDLTHESVGAADFIVAKRSQSAFDVVCFSTIELHDVDVARVQTPAQPDRKDGAFTADASETFAALSSRAEDGLLLGSMTEVNAREFVEKVISSYHLSSKDGWQHLPSDWVGIWTGQNPSGSIWLRIVSPRQPDNKDRADLLFHPATEEPIPQALLSHLLAKAESTKISSGNTLDLTFAWERPIPQAKCESQTTLTIRLGTGALVTNLITTYCDAPKTSVR